MRATGLLTVVILVLVGLQADALGRRSASRAAPSAAAAGERDISTAVESQLLPNGGLLWSVDRDGPSSTVALLVRGGSRHEDMDRPGVALSVARWVEASVSHDELARLGVSLRLTMLSGGALFTLQGPSSSLPAAMRALLKSAMRPTASLLSHARDRAALEPERSLLPRVVPDLIGAACWTGSSFELPALGTAEGIASVGDLHQKTFHAVWYRPRNMTVIALGAGGAGPFSSALAGTQKVKMAREMLSPGEPGLPVHQVLRGGSPLTVAAASTPGPQQPAAALLLRGRTFELLEEATQQGKLSAPWIVDIVWTRNAAIVYAALVHGTQNPTEQEQADQLKIIEGAMQEAAAVPDAALNELRKREGARLSQKFSTPEGALEILAPLAAVSDTPIDVRKAVMATPNEIVRAGLERARVENNRLSIRRTRQGSP